MNDLSEENNKTLIKEIFLMFIYFEREKERAEVGQRQRERERERERERIPSRLHTVSTEHDVGLDLTTLKIMT